MKKKKTSDILNSAFAELGVELEKNSCGLFMFKHKSMDYFLSVDENDKSFSISQTVVGLKGQLTKNEFNTMLNVVKSFHKNYDGEWYDGHSYLSSPCYYVDSEDVINGKTLEKIIKDFFEAWSFACVNACMLTDASIWK